MQAETVKTAIKKLTDTFEKHIFNVNSQNLNAKKCPM